jgi:hypothetical protein
VVRTVETIPDFLIRMAHKDASKGYEACGIRTTAEIAEYFVIPTKDARKYLDGYAERNVIESYGRCNYTPGRPYLWGPVIQEPDDDPDGGIPEPLNDNECQHDQSNSL